MAQQVIRKNQSKRKNHSGQSPRSEFNTEMRDEKSTIEVLRTRIKKASKQLLHDYVIPYTRMLERRLLRLEHSL